MPKALIRIVGMLFIALFTVPSVASAAWGDIIWGMKGPQMIGVDVFRWQIDFGSGIKQGSEFPSIAKMTHPTIFNRRLWFQLDGTLYLSTGKDSSTAEYHRFDTIMFEVDPMPTFKTKTFKNGWFLHHGVGPAVHLFYGDNFDHFVKTGIKFQAIALAFATGRNQKYHWDLGWNFRYYPDPFTSADFGVMSAPDAAPTEREWTWGPSFAIAWGGGIPALPLPATTK